MKEYYVDSNTLDKNYGIYDWLKEVNEKEFNIKTLGAISKDRYIFRIDIADHLCERDNFVEELGDYKFYVSTYYKGYESIVYISMYGKDMANDFIIDTCVGILKECNRYKRETNHPVKVEVCKGLTFKDTRTENIDEVISEVETCRLKPL